MTDKSVFTESEWHALTDAPLLVTAAVFFAGEHASLTPTWQQGALESAQRVLKQLLPGWPPNVR